MSSSISASSQSNTLLPGSTSSLTSSTTNPASGAVPAQHPVRSYANATKTATPPSSAGASAPAHNAKPSTDSQMNGAMAQGGSQPANTSSTNGDHSRKPSVVINASGIAGQYPNGGPVQNGSGRPNIAFGSMDQQPNAPFQQQNASLQAARQDPRVTSPAHSPSPIPQPAPSGGALPRVQGNGGPGLAFGSVPADTEMMRGQGTPNNMGPVPIHERRPSSHSMQSEASNQGINRPQFTPQGGGRGRGLQPQPQFMGSPAQSNRMPFQPGRPNVPPQFNPQAGPPGSPFRQPARESPVPMHAQPHMQPGHMGNPQMHYQYPQHLNPQQQQAMYMPQFDPNSGYYPPYGYYPGYGTQPPQSPRPAYPSPYQGPPGAPMQPPFHPPGTPGMARTPSQASERPPSSMGHPQTPAQNPPALSQTPGSQPPSASSSFVRPVKKSNAIKITDAQGNALDFTKPSTPSAQPQAPVIVSTPNAPTPPPRVPSAQHNRTESRSAKSTEETKNAFAEQVKRQVEENKRKELEAAEAEKKKENERTQQEEAAKEEIKKATADAELAAAKAAADKKAEEDAVAAKRALEEEEERKRKEQQEEDERLEREIAEMEAREREEEERERAYQEKRQKEKAAAAEKEAERAKKLDDELKRQEREAEAREEARERERESGKAAEDTDDAKSLFASLKKPAFGPGASTPASGTETPTSEGVPESTVETETPSTTSTSSQGRSGAQKPKPAHLKLETNKPVERPEPTPGMQSLKSARFLEIKEEPRYPDGFRSPNPALNQAGARKGRAYDKDFLLQFQSIFKEKPSVDWDQKVKDTLGSDEPGSARPQSARSTSGAMSRSGSGRPGAQGMPFGGAMGQFGGPMGRTLPPGTSSEQRFQASMGMGGNMAPPRPGMPGVNRTPSSLGMGTPGVGMSRTNSLQAMNMSGGSPRQASARGKGGSRRDDRQRSKREDADAAAKMPLTAHIEIAPLEKSTTGWKATSITQPAAAAPDPSGNMAPDMVQRKVKAALNKMTPEKFDKISDQILEIAAQSKSETDGRTLRQVIQLTFEKACDEAHWAGMYAKFCHKMLTAMSPEIRDETIKDKNGNAVVGGALFRKYLLNRCQEEFERGWQANLPEKPEGDSQEAALLSDEYYVAAAAKRRGLGLIQFIGQLYKLRMLTLRIMHECVMRLLNFEGDPDEAAVENLTTLLRAVGATMDEDDNGRSLINTYFQRIEDVIMKSDALPSRPKFMIMDLIDLRKAGWKGKDDSKGPKTIQQIHAEAAAAEAKAEAERQKGPRGGPGGRPPAGRGDARNFSGGMPPPVDYARTNVNMDDLRKLQQRGAARSSGGSLGPGGGLGPSMLGARSGSRRGVGNLGPGSSGTSRTNTPPVEGKKDEPATAQNAFSALATLDPSGEAPEDGQSQSEAASPPAARNRSKSPLADESNA